MTTTFGVALKIDVLAKTLSRFLKSFRYPASLPEDVISDLGITLSKTTSFDIFIDQLSSSHIVVRNLYKYMYKTEAETHFVNALKKESFKSTTFFSYYFPEGWLVIALHYDRDEKLTRLYVQCPSCGLKEGFDLTLSFFPEKMSLHRELQVGS